VAGQPDHREAAAGTEDAGHLGQRSAEVHVMQRRIGAGKVEAGIRERVVEEVAVDKADRGEGAPAFPGGLDDPLVPVDPGHGRAPRGELAGEHPVPAPDVDSRPAPVRQRLENHPLIVNVVIPVLARCRIHPPTISRRRR
jgi:hypothetical protein